jgi:hypothetical protein
MTIINITLDDQSEICFKLLENDFVEEWFAHFQQKHKFGGKLLKSIYRFDDMHIRRKPHEEAIVDIYNTVRCLRDELGIDLPIVLDTIDRQTLNQLHRFFTTMRTSGNTYDFNKPTLFNIQNSKAKFYSLLDDLNEAVHDAEQIYYDNNERLAGLDQHEYYKLKFLNRNLIEIDNKHLKYMSNKHTVYLGANILGKSYFNCYYDYDDPRYFDIKNCQHYCCDLEIEFQKPNVFNMIHNKNYQQWLTDHGIPIDEQSCGRMPIGDLISYNFTNDESRSIKIQKIEHA